MAEKRITVGVDGSEDSAVALAWALEEAGLRGWRLHVLFAWGDIGVRIARESGWAKAVTYDLEAEAARTLISDMLAAQGEKVAAIEVVFEPVPGEGAQALVEASGHSDLLVVGRRGSGGFPGLGLGSVGDQCARHAACPVVVVPMAGS